MKSASNIVLKLLGVSLLFVEVNLLNGKQKKTRKKCGYFEGGDIQDLSKVGQ